MADYQMPLPGRLLRPYCPYCHEQGAATSHPGYHLAVGTEGACTDPFSTKGLCECGQRNDGHRYTVKPRWYDDDEHEDWLEWSGGRGPNTDMWEREDDRSGSVSGLKEITKEA